VQCIWIFDHKAGQKLQGHLKAESLVIGQPHYRHPAFAKLPNQPKPVENQAALAIGPEGVDQRRVHKRGALVGTGTRSVQFGFWFRGRLTHLLWRRLGFCRQSQSSLPLH
jgi:hypothetical protein